MRNIEKFSDAEKERIIDYYLLNMSEERLALLNPKTLLSEEEVNRRPDIAEEDLEGYEEVEIE